jgi:two-component system sensor histidine kinase BaeS
MRLRLFHKLALVTSALLALTILAIAAVVIRQVNSGFNAYLDERDHDQLEAFAAVVRSALQQGSGSLNMLDLLDEQARRQQGGARPRRQGPPPQWPEEGPPDGKGPPRADEPPAGLPGPMGEGLPGAGFGGRVAVLSPDGRVLAGRGFPPDAAFIEEPVMLNGKLAARVQLMKLHRASEDLDRRFLRDQVQGIAVVSGLAFVLALCGILWFSQRLVQPLRAAQIATSRIARGDFSIRLPEGGTDETADLVRDINAMAGSLETLENSRKNWLAQLSHELRTPLTVLQGGCEAMMDGVRPVSVQGVGALHQRVLALKRIVEDLHTVSLADLGSLPHLFTEMDAVEAVSRVIAACREHQGIQVTFENTLTALPVCWDAGRIQQLLENLLENSLRYTDAPGQIKVHLTVEGDWVTLRWEDSAPGVPHDDLEKLFEPLYRADPARSRKLGGSGLGLAICRAIASAHFGEISASASPLGGVCIAVKLSRDPSHP